ncbi:MAG TPA: hemerythrin domain-containing protein [Solirubrobacterales bacterium]
MKRDQALKRLSRDHHRALEVALKLRRATDADAEPVAREFLAFWREHGALHFRVEEDVLLPAFARHGDPRAAEVVRVLTDHVEIRRRAADLEASTETRAGDLNALGEMLNDHVRHEERVLFPLIEESLPPRELEELAQRVEEAERSG